MYRTFYIVICNMLNNFKGGLPVNFSDLRFQLDKRNSTCIVCCLIKHLTRFLGNNIDNMESHSLWKNL